LPNRDSKLNADEDEETTTVDGKKSIPKELAMDPDDRLYINLPRNR
jgi:hypothetical protein